MRGSIKGLFLTPAGGSGFFGTLPALLRRDIVCGISALTPVFQKSICEFLFLEQLIVAFLANVWHNLTLSVGGFSKRVLTLPFRCANIGLGFLNYLLCALAGGIFNFTVISPCELILISVISIFSPPFYRRLLILLPLLLYFYYSTLAGIKSRLFGQFFGDFLKFSTSKNKEDSYGK